jgi:Flp pilus assembly protein TadB
MAEFSSASAALVCLATAIPLWSASGVARVRLAALTGAIAPAPRWRRHTIRVLCGPAPLAGSLGVLSGLVVGRPGGLPAGAVVATVAWTGVRWLRRRSATTARRADHAEALSLAAGWDLLAACLRAGLPVPTAVRAVTADLPRQPATALRATADLLAIGVDPVAAWAPALNCPATAEFARGARRTARSGTALAAVAADAARGIRDAAGDAAEAEAQRAGVLITGPLGLCFLPAFVCLGIVPVVAGLAAQLSVHH